jgi:diguanylate cyclase (GGDEF)-like protein
MGQDGAATRLPVPAHVALVHLATRPHGLYAMGDNLAALEAAEQSLPVAELLGDRQAARRIVQTQMYVLADLGRYVEALTVGRDLLSRPGDTRAATAKTTADLADVLVRMGRLDEGLHLLARATALLETCPRTLRYASAQSSIAEAAKWAELYELADEASAVGPEIAPTDTINRACVDLQRAELLMEWGLRLEHIDHRDEAGVRYAQVIALVRPWLGPEVSPDFTPQQPLAEALLALALAKTGVVDEAVELAAAMIVPMRRQGQHHEARLAHLALGVALRARGDYTGARRELVAAEDLSARTGQRRHRMIFQYEVALLAAQAHPGTATADLLTALRAHARELWHQRLDRVTMLRQARHRVEMEAERASADAAALQDPLTGLGNRRAFDRWMSRLDSDRVASGPVTLLLVDLDHFKEINDDFSHAVGDRVLCAVAEILRAHCTAEEQAVRFGGDEFAVFLRVDLATATRVAQRIRTGVSALDWAAVAPGLRVTVSIGVAGLGRGMSGAELFDAADRQMYEAKRRGRDRMVA